MEPKKQTYIYKYFPFFITLLLGLIFHGYQLVNNSWTSSDNFLVSSNGWGWAIAQGRWAQPLFDVLSGKYAFSYITGIFAIMYFAISMQFLVYTFDIKNKITIILIASLIVSMPILAPMFAFTALVDNAFAPALLLSVLAIYLIKKYKFGFLISSLCVTLSLACYQSFVAIFLCLSFCFLFLFFLKNEFKKEFWIFCMKFLACFVIGVLIYIISIKITDRIYVLASRQNMSSIGKLSLNFKTIILSFVFPVIFLMFNHVESEQVYFSKDFLRTLINSMKLDGFYGFVIPVIISIFFLITIYSIFKISKNKKIFLISIVFYFAMMFSSGIIFQTNAEIYHAIMYAGFYFLLISSLIIIDKAKINKKLNIISIICVIIFVVSNFIIINNSYLANSIALKQGQDYYASFQTDILKSDGYDKDKKIMLIASENWGNHDNLKENYVAVNNKGYFLNKQLYPKHIAQIITYLNDYSYLPNKYSEYNQEFNFSIEEMPCYPNIGSIICLEDSIVVKLSE